MIDQEQPIVYNFNRPIRMRISNSDAKKLAISLAEAYLTTAVQKEGWLWVCVDAQPDGIRNRKTYTNWAVIVEWTHNGHVIDSSAILLVNVQSGEVANLADGCTRPIAVL
ncbi:hypothetical protein GN109_25610 [Collimonas pratensis]|uniref:hypothetical protein n=1 Tax=Collimonas pratensis TaxID=279113 RepID=UPI00143CC74D|nr:hypothetical protein [Collimonas pratensis]NKI72798.1 hypothetical protein [Collimonas pratensis]